MQRNRLKEDLEMMRDRLKDWYNLQISFDTVMNTKEKGKKEKLGSKESHAEENVKTLYKR